MGDKKKKKISSNFSKWNQILVAMMAWVIFSNCGVNVSTYGDRKCIFVSVIVIGLSFYNLCLER